MTTKLGFDRNYKPTKATRLLLEEAMEVIADYKAKGIYPLSIRQIYYRLCGTGVLPKTADGYNRLANALKNARRGRWIDFADIRDDSLETQGKVHDSGTPAEFLEEHLNEYYYARDPWQDQSVKVIIWCESKGMVPMLAQGTSHYRVPVSSTSGYDSVTAKHNLAKQLEQSAVRGFSTKILHFGDYDPAGVGIFNSVSEDTRAFMTFGHNSVDFIRVGLTEELIHEYGIITDDVKADNKLEFEGVNGDGVSTAQLEALDPAILQQLAVDEVTRHIDTDLWELSLDRERQDRKRIRNAFDMMMEAF